MFVRAGTILPRQPLVQSTMQVPQGPLELDVYPGEDCRGELYFDDGVHITGPSLRQSIELHRHAERRSAALRRAPRARGARGGSRSR